MSDDNSLPFSEETGSSAEPLFIMRGLALARIAKAASIESVEAADQLEQAVASEKIRPCPLFEDPTFEKMFARYRTEIARRAAGIRFTIKDEFRIHYDNWDWDAAIYFPNHMIIRGFESEYFYRSDIEALCAALTASLPAPKQNSSSMGRPDGWPWPEIVAEVAFSIAGHREIPEAESLIAEVQEVAARRNSGKRPARSTAQPYAQAIRRAWDRSAMASANAEK